jgi:hypothetical protein
MKERVMILELAWPYIPVVVIGLFWAVAMRPVLRLIHAASTASPGAGLSGRERQAQPRRRTRR